MKLSYLSETLIGSEIVKLGGEIREKINQGQTIYNFTVGDFDPSIFPIPAELEELIVDVPQGKVAYGVVDFGGFLGLGEQSTAVPWDMFAVQTTGDTPNLMLDVTADSLENAPTIDLGAWPSWPERVEGQDGWTTDWDAQIRTFWSGAASS